MRKLSVCVIAVLASFALVTPASAAPPTNDNFADATTIASLPFSEETTVTTDASVEVGEPVNNSCVTGDPPPDGANDSVAKTVWYTYTPAQDQNFAADTFGSVAADDPEPYDTVIVLWEGTTLATLQEVACSDDSGPDFGSHSRVGFPLEGGVKYYLQIGSWTGEDGEEPPNVIPPDTGTLHVHANVRTFLPGAVRGATWFLAEPGLTGVESFQFGIPGFPDDPLVGTTTGDGISKPVIRNDNVFFFNFWFDAIPEAAFAHGRFTDFPLLGDFEGDTLASPGVVRGNTWYLVDSTDGSLITFTHGRSTDYPIVGDWNGDGTETPGLIRGNQWLLTNTIPPSAPLIVFSFARATDFPVVGDWDGNGHMEPGAVRGNVWYQANATPPTALHDSFAFAGGNDFPIAGDWDGAVTGLGVGGSSNASAAKRQGEAAGPLRWAS